MKQVVEEVLESAETVEGAAVVEEAAAVQSAVEIEEAPVGRDVVDIPVGICVGVEVLYSAQIKKITHQSATLIL